MHEDIDTAEMIERRLDDGFTALGSGHRIGAGDSLSSRSLDFPNDFFRGTRIDSIALYAATHIVDDNSCALRCQQQCVSTPQPPAGAGNHRYTIVESAFSH